MRTETGVANSGVGAQRLPTTKSPIDLSEFILCLCCFDEISMSGNTLNELQATSLVQFEAVLACMNRLQSPVFRETLRSSHRRNQTLQGRGVMLVTSNLVL